MLPPLYTPEDETNYDVISVPIDSFGAVTEVSFRDTFTFYRETTTRPDDHPDVLLSGGPTTLTIYRNELEQIAFVFEEWADGQTREQVFVPSTLEVTLVRRIDHNNVDPSYDVTVTEQARFDGVEYTTRTTTTHDDGRVEVVTYDTSSFEARQAGLVSSHTISGTDENGNAFVDTLEADVVVQRVTTDVGDDDPFTTVTESFEFGNLTERHVEIDDGSTRTSTFTEGTRTRTEIDLDGEAGNAGSVVTFDTDGNRLSDSVTLADGLTTTRNFSDGVLIGWQQEDTEDAYDFAARFRIYRDNGEDAPNRTELVGTLVEEDGGRVISRSFSDGNLTSIAIADRGDEHAWETRSRSYNDEGELVEHRVTLDSGLTRTDSYADGVLTSRVLEDGGDEFAWNTRETTYDAQGNVIDVVTELDPPEEDCSLHDILGPFEGPSGPFGENPEGEPLFPDEGEPLPVPPHEDCDLIFT